MPPATPSRTPNRLAYIALGLLLVGAVITFLGAGQRDIGIYLLLLTLAALGAFVCGLLAIILHKRAAARGLPLAGGIVAVVLAVVGWAGGALVIILTQATSWLGSTGGGGGGGGFGLGGGAWGRPLRIRGRQLHPALATGTDWTDGPRPDPSGLDEPTRRALEALWLHDAQKEHASVPAFSRVSWLLAASGGPAELMAWAHRAAIEEIEHTQACFALAAGYGGRTFTVEPMPDLMLGGLDGRSDPRVLLATESLTDGCQLEDFNADVAAACAEACEEPVTRAVLETIAREERSHAEFSWAVLAWLVARDRAVVEGPLAEAARGLDAYPRPTAVSADKRELVARASAAALRRHGRLPDVEWAALWDARLVATRARLDALLRAPAQPEPTACAA